MKRLFEQKLDSVLGDIAGNVYQQDVKSDEPPQKRQKKKKERSHTRALTKDWAVQQLFKHVFGKLIG